MPADLGVEYILWPSQDCESSVGRDVATLRRKFTVIYKESRLVPPLTRDCLQPLDL